MQNGIYKSKGYAISKIGTEFGLPVKTSMRLPLSHTGVLGSISVFALTPAC